MHCDSHTVCNDAENGGKLPFLKRVADRCAQLRRAMADIRAFFASAGPPIMPSFGPSVVTARAAGLEAAAGAVRIGRAIKPMVRLRWTRHGWFRVFRVSGWAMPVVIGPFGTAEEALHAL